METGCLFLDHPRASRSENAELTDGPRETVVRRLALRRRDHAQGGDPNREGREPAHLEARAGRIERRPGLPDHT